ncbi:uncharacterized protein LOC119391925 isoform X2 [Rhipicephalus sanguineus]|uniref:uncharacterized protein LOC119391925 isoform X2 n=1 Tax=Rhipicephalus sanguineus TaxID=34632 RepID=UPI0020C2A01D|nr:uncharacterized protein LOC119391925 isoform X2 [Rhipicephalus sanguineus]
MDKKEAASKRVHEKRKAEGTSAGAVAAAGVEPPSPCEGHGTAAKRKVKTAMRRLLTFVGTRDDSRQLESSASQNPLAKASISTSKTNEGPPSTDDQRGDADIPRHSFKQVLLSKVPTMFGGSGLWDTAAARVTPSCVESPSAKNPQGFDSVCGGSQDGLAPAKRPATAFHGSYGAAHCWPTRISTVSPAPRCSQDGDLPSAEDVVIEDVEMEDLSDAIGESLSQQVPLTDFKGTYVVSDTNIFLSNLDLLKKIVLPDTGNEDMVLCVPWMAIQELDNIKTKKKGPLSSSAVAAIKFIYQALSSKNPRLRGQTVAEARQKDDALPKGCELNDDHFLHWCLEFKKQGSKVLLISNDRNLRNKAMINSIDTLSADELEKKLFPPAAKSNRRRTPLPKSSTKQQKRSSLSLQSSEHRLGAKQEQSDAAKETSAASDTPTYVVPPRAPGRDAVSTEVREILRRSLDLVLKSELESAFGSIWLRVVDFKPPWTEETALQCILRHWIALTGTAFKSSLKPVISSLLSKLSSNFGSSENVKIAQLATQLCSELQLHYPQLAGDVARLKELSELEQAPVSTPTRPDGQTGLLPSLTCSRALSTTSRLMMPSDYKPPMNDVPRAKGEERKDVAAKRPQSSGISVPFRVTPGRHNVVERLPLRRPKEALQQQLEQPQQNNLPPNPPVPETTTPLTLFQESWAALNDYWHRTGHKSTKPTTDYRLVTDTNGTLCSKIPVAHRHEFPFNMRAEFKADRAFICETYGIVVRVLDYMNAVVRELGASRDRMVDLAEALIEALTKLLEKLRHEGIPKEKTWEVKLEEMVNFLVDESNKDLLIVGKRQIAGLHDSLGQCLIHVTSPTKPLR